MKQSKYNRVLHITDKALVFNCTTCGFAEFDFETFELLQALANDNISDSQQQKLITLLPELKRGNFVIEADEDELSTLRVIHQIQKYSNATMGLTIAPTLGCNFNCPYCYEGNKSFDRMSNEVQSAIIRFVEKHQQLQNLSVCWFGGEPLLCDEIIYKMSEELISLCEKNKCTYTASLVTNGWFLTSEVAQRLKDLRVAMVQVTLDGTAESHNARRCLKDGSGTFDRILENVIQASEFLPISIRINVDKSNADSVIQLYELLNQQQLLGKIQPYLGQVRGDTEACADFSPNCYDAASFSTLEIKLHQDLVMKGIPSRPLYPRFLTNFCGANLLHAYTIDPWGWLYKCWSTIGNENDRVGNVLYDDPTKLSTRAIKWLNIQPFDVPECVKCDVLPICSGGCPYHHYLGRYAREGKPDCPSWCYNLDQTLLSYYQAWRESQT